MFCLIVNEYSPNEKENMVIEFIICEECEQEDNWNDEKSDVFCHFSEGKEYARDKS